MGCQFANTPGYWRPRLRCLLLFRSYFFSDSRCSALTYVVLSILYNNNRVHSGGKLKTIVALFPRTMMGKTTSGERTSTGHCGHSVIDIRGDLLTQAIRVIELGLYICIEKDLDAEFGRTRQVGNLALKILPASYNENVKISILS